MKHPYNFMILASNLPWMYFFLGHVGIDNNDGLIYILFVLLG